MMICVGRKLCKLLHFHVVSPKQRKKLSKAFFG